MEDIDSRTPGSRPGPTALLPIPRLWKTAPPFAHPTNCQAGRMLTETVEVRQPRPVLFRVIIWAAVALIAFFLLVLA